jgi:hypothetical protein
MQSMLRTYCMKFPISALRSWRNFCVPHGLVKHANVPND